MFPSSSTKKWNPLGDTFLVASSNDHFGTSISTSADGRTVAEGAPHNDDNGEDSGHVILFTHSSTTNKWNPLGNILVGTTSDDIFGTSVSMSADGKTVAASSPYKDDNGLDIDHVRVFTCASTKNIWNHLGNTALGASTGNHFGWSMSTSRVVKTDATRNPLSDHNGVASIHVRIFTYSNKWNQLGNHMLGFTKNGGFG